MFSAYLISDVFSIPQVLRFVVITVVGNLIGGSIFVALLNYGHIRKTQKTEEKEEAPFFLLPGKPDCAARIVRQRSNERNSPV
jgi:glycerol uptake facilitator-like aquaporin